MKELFQSYQKLVVFDTETTGLSPELDEIIQFSAAVLTPDGTVDTYDQLVSLTPGGFVPPRFRPSPGLPPRCCGNGVSPKPGSAGTLRT